MSSNFLEDLGLELIQDFDNWYEGLLDPSAWLEEKEEGLQQVETDLDGLGELEATWFELYANLTEDFLPRIPGVQQSLNLKPTKTVSLKLDSKEKICLVKEIPQPEDPEIREVVDRTSPTVNQPSNLSPEIEFAKDAPRALPDLSRLKDAWFSEELIWEDDIDSQADTSYSPLARWKGQSLPITLMPPESDDTAPERLNDLDSVLEAIWQEVNQEA